MRVIKLDATDWKSKDDFYEAILAALEAPSWHGRNADALIDSMWGGSINGIEPPYKIWITGTRAIPPEVKQRIDWMIDGINAHQGREAEILFQIDP
jgi:RNAse (barnase) inhibitor barstar